MSYITIISKPLLFCNVSCKHCSVERKHIYNLDPDFYVSALRRIITFLHGMGTKVTKIEMVWHGGEPLLAGKEFYLNVYKQLDQKFSEVKITHSIQTNLLKYDHRWNDVFSKVFEWNVSTSYDFFSSLRPYSPSVFLNKLKAYQDASGKPGYVICVLNKENYERVLDICEIAEKNKFNIKFNYLYPAGSGKSLDVFTPDDYLQSLKTVFKNRGSFPSVVIDPIDLFIDYVRGKIPELPCPITNKCLGRIFALMPDGNIYQCGEMADIGAPPLGNVKEGIFTERYVEILQSSLVVNEECIECGLCGGGCLKQRILYANDINTSTPFCRVWKYLYRSAESYLSTCF